MDFTPPAPVPTRGINPIEAPMTLSAGPLGQVRFVPVRGARSVVIAVAVPAGARDEKKGEEGVAHFLEHVLFKRTASYDGAIALWSAIETLGGEANAATDRELTTYFVEVPRANLTEAAALLGEILFASTYTSEDIETERGVIIEEIRGHLDDPDELASLGLDLAIFGPGHVYARDIAGSPEAVRRLTEKTIRSFHARHYIPSLMSVAVTGDLNPGEVSRAREALTKHLPADLERKEMRAPREIAKHPASPMRAKGELVAAKESDVAQARIAIGVPTFGRHHPSEAAIDVLGTILGGGSGSRLFIKLREEAGLAYSVDTETFEYAEAGSFTVTAGVDPDRLVEASEAIVAELRRIAKEEVSESELARAKGYIIGGLERFSADLEGVADWRAGEPLLSRQTRRIEEEIERIRKVDADDITEVAALVFRKGQLRFSVVAPTSALKAFKTALRKGKLDL